MMLVPFAAAALLWFLLSRTRSTKRLLRAFLPRLWARAVAVLLVVLALLVAARGNAWAALCLFGAALWSLGRMDHASPPSGQTAAYAPMLRDDAAGLRIVAGRFAGQPVDTLDRAACLALLAECRMADPVSARLLEAYLDRRFAGWRPAGDGDADTRGRSSGLSGEMGEDQAYQILSLGRGATRAEVVRAHRLAMKRWHPDQGGSTEQAARANQAKEILLRRHE